MHLFRMSLRMDLTIFALGRAMMTRIVKKCKITRFLTEFIDYMNKIVQEMAT